MQPINTIIPEAPTALDTLVGTEIYPHLKRVSEQLNPPPDDSMKIPPWIDGQASKFYVCALANVHNGRDDSGSVLMMRRNAMGELWLWISTPKGTLLRGHASYLHSGSMLYASKNMRATLSPARLRYILKLLGASTAVMPSLNIEPLDKDITIFSSDHGYTTWFDGEIKYHRWRWKLWFLVVHTFLYVEVAADGTPRVRDIGHTQCLMCSPSEKGNLWLGDDMRDQWHFLAHFHKEAERGGVLPEAANTLIKKGFFTKENVLAVYNDLNSHKEFTGVIKQLYRELEKRIEPLK